MNTSGNDHESGMPRAVGFPFDGDTRAGYCLARWTGAAWQFEDRRVVYDVEAVAADIESADIPFRERYARMLREANWFPRTEAR